MERKIGSFYLVRGGWSWFKVENLISTPKISLHATFIVVLFAVAKIWNQPT
jgi:hypothetical protein